MNFINLTKFPINKFILDEFQPTLAAISNYDCLFMTADDLQINLKLKHNFICIIIHNHSPLPHIHIIHSSSTFNESFVIDSLIMIDEYFKTTN